MPLIHALTGLLGVVLSCVAAGYEAMALLAVLVWTWRRTRVPPGVPAQAVTLLKPLCGAEPGLYENLRSFCLQDYPQYQIVFGIQDEADPALAGRCPADPRVSRAADRRGRQSAAARLESKDQQPDQHGAAGQP